MKDHLESLKCLRRSMAPKPGTDQFFQKGRSLYPIRGGGGGGAGAATSEEEAGVRGTTPINQEAETDTSKRRTISARNNDSRICTCKCVHVSSISPCNARDANILSLHHFQPVEMHGNRTYSYRASKEKPSTSRKDKALPTQLGKANPRSLGIGGCTGLQGAFHPTALPKAASKASKTLRGRGESPAGRDPEHDNIKCYRRDHTQRARFPVHSLPGTKEGWRSETSHQSKKSEQTEHFKTEGIHILKDLLRAGDWMTKVDLKDATSWCQYTRRTEPS